MSKIRELRKAAGFTQVTFAEAMGVTQSTVSQWESGRVLPDTAKLPKLAEVLGCSVADLFTKKEPETA